MKAAEEQDEAAGGRERRRKKFGKKRYATASIELKRPHDGRAVWAYLRWFEDGKTQNQYVGRDFGKNRKTLLAEGWNLAREKKLV
ncbi:hypothetical protein S1OALGB6SA_1545 [Olavius algarvensis spirochete endosymbiont]|uniref:hypothetical protein n=1 Tax=Olavius algarvensis spirochete endosymbiont TaxID=260710 RepID=UPI000F0E9AAC|nr:hypothetical protein [Olavius algarvensis spirochete endosymbiont]VDB00463.1 hypothetical protein S1OALGB6SA_1545 [Olavius algarvensis spirochete endosymbiont]